MAIIAVSWTIFGTFEDRTVAAVAVVVVVAFSTVVPVASWTRPLRLDYVEWWLRDGEISCVCRD